MYRRGVSDLVRFSARTRWPHTHTHTRWHSERPFSASAGPRTLYDKIWDSHIVNSNKDGSSSLIYIDRHLVHEVTSPQAFEGLRVAGRQVRRPDCTLAVCDHNVPTTDRSKGITEPESKLQVDTLETNVKEFGLEYFGMNDKRQGIVHIIGPEQGFTQPGMTIVCGDSHTATHGAFGALAFGIGTSEIEHVFATQTLVQQKAKNMRITVDGALPVGITSKDLVLKIISVIGTAGGNGHVIEYAGEAIRNLSMESRMTVCNMSIEGGARAGMVAPDEVTAAYLKGKPMAPTAEHWDRAVEYWMSLQSEEGSSYDKEVTVSVTDIAPQVTWGTSPEDVVPITGVVPDPMHEADPSRQRAFQRSLDYMGLKAGQSMQDITIDKVFIGSCTNGRIEDIRAVADVANGKMVAHGVHALVVPGSGLVKMQAEDEGLDKVLKEAGFDWREPGCSMCLAMNADRLEPGQRCASTSNRNFEGRQGRGGRTHLMSPGMAAAAAVAGRLTDVRQHIRSYSNFTRPRGGCGCCSPKVSSSHLSSSHMGKTNTNRSFSTGTANPLLFRQLAGVAAPMEQPNVDTDMIIPKQFLKTITRTGLGKSAFWETRYEENGDENPEFVLNQTQYRAAKVLVAGENFGCGSSREHAPWALLDFGIRCVVAPSFADIFFNNCFKNGMLPIEVSAERLAPLMKYAKQPNSQVDVDLETQTITYGDSVLDFQTDPFRRECLLNGWDDIALTLKEEASIDAYENTRRSERPWL